MAELFGELGYFFRRQKLNGIAAKIDVRTSGAQAGLGVGLSL